MHLELLDWVVMVSFLVLIVWVGLRYTGESSKSLEAFFVGNRSMPWYLAGLSMVATTFAADTPLAVTELVVQQGIAGNWLWWSFLAGGMLTTFFFAKLWQRSGVLTEAEFIELRYSGAEARFLRGFKSVYLGLVLNAVIIAWVNAALMSLLEVFFDLSKDEAFLYTGLVLVITAIYSTFSGFKGVVVTDAIQFVIAMAGCIILAILVVNSSEIGGLSSLKSKIYATYGNDTAMLDFFPSVLGSGSSSKHVLTLTPFAFLAYIGVQWWASWYPGAEPGGGGYVAQRILSTRSEKDAVWATLFFQIAHYCIRPWAWIVVALAGSVLYGTWVGNVYTHTGDVKLYYAYAMRDFLPVGLKGLLLVAFFAAYMSTISTQLNWGASCLVNDLYKRFLHTQDTNAHYVAVSRWTTVGLAIVGAIVTQFVQEISGAWGFIMQCGAGLGLVLILRWYWRRINAWSEIAAMFAPAVATAFCAWQEVAFPDSFLLTVAFTTVVWLVVTFATPPTDADTLQRFWQRVHPRQAQTPTGYYAYVGVSWLSAIVLAYSVLFLIGKLILLEWVAAAVLAGVMLVAGGLLRWTMQKTM